MMKVKVCCMFCVACAVVQAETFIMSDKWQDRTWDNIGNIRWCYFVEKNQSKIFNWEYNGGNYAFAACAVLGKGKNGSYSASDVKGDVIVPSTLLLD